MAVSGSRFGGTEVAITFAFSSFLLTLAVAATETAEIAYSPKGKTPKQMNENIAEIYKFVQSLSTNDNAGYVIQARSDPKRLLFVGNNVRTDIRQSKPEKSGSQKQEADSSEVDNPLRFNNINLHLHIMNPSNMKTDEGKVRRGIYEGIGQRWKRRLESSSDSGVNPDGLQAMKRVIFIRCPFYACPQGHICDYHTRSCRPVLYPDIDY